MARFGTVRCSSRLVVLVGISLALAGCSTVAKTFDTKPDPELLKPGVYPNINLSGKPTPGHVLTPEQQASAQASLLAKGAAASPQVGAAAKLEGEKQTAELSKLAKTHAANALKDIQNGCDMSKPVDATKCPQ